MSLLDELKKKLNHLELSAERKAEDIETTERTLDVQRGHLRELTFDILDVKKAISALTPEGKEALLDDQPEPSVTEVRKQDEQDAAGEIISGEPWEMSEADAALSNWVAAEMDAPPSPEVASEQGVTGADVPEESRDEVWLPPAGYTYIPTQGVRCNCIDLMQDSIGNFFCCNKRGEASAEAERIEDASQGTLANEQTPEHLALLPTPQDDREAETDAAVFAHGLNIEIDQKAQDQKFNPFRLFRQKADA